MQRSLTAHKRSLQTSEGLHQQPGPGRFWHDYSYKARLISLLNGDLFQLWQFACAAAGTRRLWDLPWICGRSGEFQWGLSRRSRLSSVPQVGHAEIRGARSERLSRLAKWKQVRQLLFVKVLGDLLTNETRDTNKPSSTSNLQIAVNLPVL